MNSKNVRALWVKSHRAAAKRRLHLCARFAGDCVIQVVLGDVVAIRERRRFTLNLDHDSQPHGSALIIQRKKFEFWMNFPFKNKPRLVDV